MKSRITRLMLLFCLILFMLFIFTGCVDDVNTRELAKFYKLDLNYYDNAVKFADLNMYEEALSSCNRTTTLRNDCFTSLVQIRLSKQMHISKEICDEINPNEKINMTMLSFRLVYPLIDKPLKKEFENKMNPSDERITTLMKIRDDCYNS